MLQATSVTPSEPRGRSRAPEPYPLLAAARVVSRYCLPEGELSHVTRLLDAFLDEFSDKWTLVQSYKQTSSLRLMQYIAARHPATEMDPFFGRWVFNTATKLVASRGDLPALQWLAESYLPDASMATAVEAAATNGYLHILEWLFDRHGDQVDWGCMELCGALENNHVEVVEWLRMHTAPRAECVPMVLRSAAKAGNLVVVQWLCEKYNADAEDAFVYAQRSCQWATARWLLANCALPSGRINWDAAAADGALAYLQFAHSRVPQDIPDWPSTLPAAANGHLDVLQWLYSELGLELTEMAMRQAAENGHLNVVQWLHAKNGERRGIWPMDGVAQSGHLEILRWLHDNRSEGCTEMAMTWAANNGRLDIVQWLHTNRTEGCTVMAMDRAARNNRKNVVQWLHEHRNEGCTPAAMDRAAGAGHLEMVRWLHTHRKEGCTTDAMDTAAGGGHLDVIKWLHANRSEGCKTWAMNSAAASGHLEVVKWLHANRREGCTVEAMTDAAINGHLAVVKWLHENRSEGCRADTMGQAAEKGHLEVVKFLHKNRGEVDARLAMEKATEFGRFEVVLYLHAEHVKVRDLDDGTVLGRLSWEMAEWLITNYAEQVNGCKFESHESSEREEPPSFTMRTAITIKIPSCSESFAEKAVMVKLDLETPMLFQGSDAPCVFINVRNIGNIDSDHNPKTAKALTETVTEVLNVPADRVFLNLEDISAGNWAFAGGRWSHAPVRGRPKVTRYHLLHGKNSKTMQAFMQCVPSSAALPGSTRELNPKIAVSLAATAAEVLADRVFLI